MTLKFKTLQQHRADVQKIQAKFATLRNQSAPKVVKSAAIKSNMMRGIANYRRWRNELNLDILDSVIEIDPLSQTVWVEPQVPMDELTEALLAKGMVVPVTPEFKGITVGGAVNGTAIESSSHRYGLFHDTCIAYHILIGDGSVLRVTPDKYPDLFHGISGSFGSLGILLLVEIKAVSATRLVELVYHPCYSIPEGLKKIQELHQKSTSPEFLEGIVYKHNRVAIIEGHWSDEKIATLKLNQPWSQWYYNHVEKACFQQNQKQETLTVQDYLFRHDTGAFWMGAYGLYGELLTRYYLEGRLGLSKLSQKLLGSLQVDKFSNLKNPGLMTRMLVNWMLPSRKLYQMLHTDTEKWFEERFVIQDYFIPLQHAKAFIEQTIVLTGIFPLWLCPVKGTTQAQILAPHQSQKETLYIDVGVYGLPNKSNSLQVINRQLDQWMRALDGRKMLYSYSFYNAEEFWEIYPKISYENLRNRYFAANLWPSVEEKTGCSLSEETHSEKRRTFTT